MKKILISTLLLTICLALTAIPKWYNNPRDFFDSNEFIVGIGSGSNYEQALTNAKNDLLQQISVKVESTTEVQAKSIESEGKEFYSESIQKATKMTVNQTLQGMDIVQQEVEKNTTYIMVSLNKTKMLNSLKGELNQKYASIKSLVNDAAQMSGEGKIIPAINNLIDAQKIIPDYYSRKALYDSFSDRPFFMEEEITVNKLESLIRTTLSAIRFDVVSGNQQIGKKGSQLPEPIVFKAVYRSKSGEVVPIISFPVKVQYSDGAPIEKGLTNSEGLFTVNVMATPLSGDRGKVVIRMDSFMLPSYFNAYVNSINGEAFYKTTETNSVVVRVSVSDAKNVRQQKVERRLTKVLNDNNVQVNDVSPLFMVGKLAVKETKQIESMGTPKTLAKVEMDIQFGIIKTKEILGTITATGQGMSEKSEADAIEKAYDNLNINARELKQMLAQCEDKIQDALMRALALEERSTPNTQPIKPAVKPQDEPERKVVQEPVKETVTQPTSTEPDIHGFNADDFIYTQKAFTNDNTVMWARVGRMMVKAGSDTKNQAKLFDHEKAVEVWTEFAYKTAPAQINNVKDGDVIFVFQNGKRPLDRRQAITGQWKMVRINNTEELFKGEVRITASPWEVPLEACRVIIK